MRGILEASDVVLRHAVGIVRVLRLTASVDSGGVIEASGVEPLGRERSRGKDQLTTLIWLSLCSGVCRKSPGNGSNRQTSYYDDEKSDQDNETSHN
jgi:hypothetical protein